MLGLGLELSALLIIIGEMDPHNKTILEKMKTKKEMILKYDSLAMNNLVRKRMPRPSIRFVDKKKMESKLACR